MARYTRNKRRKSRRMKGGNWGQVINQAAAPIALVGLNQIFTKKPKFTKRHRSMKKRSRR